MHDIKESLNKGLKATLLIIDIKGAFNAILLSRLVYRLYEQGWPDNLIYWV
jgi:hypothetical protein